MGNIVFIAPYPELASLAREICTKNHPEVEVFDGLLDEGLVCARKSVARGAQVIISRGGTANLIRKNIGVPVVEVRVTGYDILRTLSEFLNKNVTVGVVGYRNVVEGCKSICQCVSMPLRELLTVNSNENPEWEEVQRILGKKIANKPVDVLIGDTLVVSKLRLNVPEVRLIYSGEEAVSETIEEAKRIFKVQTEEKKATEQLRAILTFIHDGVLAVDHLGNITVMNLGAEKIFNSNATQSIGKNITQVIPNTRMAEVLQHGVAELEQLQNTPSGMVVTNRVPIEVNGVVQGVVATFQEAGRIQKTEQKIRTQLYTKGLYAKYSFDDIMAEDPEMRLVIDRAKRYATSDGTVLIQAESGCGKELFAQSIHQAGNRCKGPFVALNCSALPTQLLESELFGYVEGAFTGARKEGKPGLIELAHGGTLFLDEIGDMELSLQARLLRVLEERQVMRLGANNWIPIDIRILAATNVPLKDRAFHGQFRLDLYYRLNVLSLAIPPLRQRKMDITPLAKCFLDASSAKNGNSPITLTPQATELLQQYSWPGNIRELRNTMERLALIYDDAEDLSEVIRGFFREGSESLNLVFSTELSDKNVGSASELEAATPSQIPVHHDMRAMKKQLAISTLAACGGNKSRAAKQLGITRYTLDRLLK